MATRRKCIRLNPIEHDTLARLYVERQIATDRYMHRPDALADLTAMFNALTGRNDKPGDILHYMQSKRRHKGKFPTLNGSHVRLPVVLGRLVDDDHIEVLKGLFAEFRVGVERFVQDDELARALARRFMQITGVRKRGYVLATAMLELRKRGDLPKLDLRNDSAAFDDFDAAEGIG